MNQLVSPPRSEQPQEVNRWRYFVTQILNGKLPFKVWGDAGSKFGTDTNYTEFEADGTMTANGSATCWDDLRIEPAVRGTDANRTPTLEKYFDDVAGTSIGVFLYSFDDAALANEKQIHFTMQMPHTWKGTDIYIHVHWVGAVDDTPATPRWGLEYAWADINTVYGDTTTIYGTGQVGGAADVTANKHAITSFAAITPTTSQDGISSVLIGRLFRNSSNAEDTYNASGAKCGLLYIDAHYEVNTLGSRSEFTK